MEKGSDVYRVGLYIDGLCKIVDVLYVDISIDVFGGFILYRSFGLVKKIVVLRGGNYVRLVIRDRLV